MKRRCENCEWWEPDDLGDEDEGLCKRYAPTIVCGMCDVYEEEQTQHALFPSTVRGQWCGEFKEKGRAEMIVPLSMGRFYGRALGVLQRNGIKNFNDLFRLENVIALRGVGSCTHSEIIEVMREMAQQFPFLLQEKDNGKENNQEEG